MIGKRIAEINVGDKASFEKTLTETDVYLYAGITGDLNPAHINQPAAEKSMFKGRIVHGMLTAGLVSGVLGMQLPGPGTIYLGQELKFRAPVKFGDTIKAEVEAIEKNEEKNRVKFKTTCTNQDGVVVLDGVATVMPPK
ncbi:MAG: MaoC family dehydratase [Clostridiaceae bacterium]|nr:MaoC family dehydratase [Clostridiaceae bacterium]